MSCSLLTFNTGAGVEWRIWMCLWWWWGFSFLSCRPKEEETMPYFHGVAQGRAPCAWQPQMEKERSSSTAMGRVWHSGLWLYLAVISVFTGCCWILGMGDHSTSSGWILYKSTAKKYFDSKQIPQTSVNRTGSLIFLERHKGWSTDGKVANVLREANSNLWGSLCGSQVPGGDQWYLCCGFQRCEVGGVKSDLHWKKVRQNTLDKIDFSKQRAVKRFLLLVASGEAGKAQHWAAGSLLQFQGNWDHDFDFPSTAWPLGAVN